MLDAFGELRRFMHEQRIDRDAGVLVAVSGGRDSVVLAHAFHRLARGRQPWRWRVVTMNHGLRPAAKAEVKFVQDLCERWQVACDIVQLEPPPRFSAGSLDWARQERRAHYQRLAATHQLAFVATGHHLADLAETMLMRLMRGGSPESIAGMRDRNGLWLRPLLRLTPSDLDHYLAKHHLPHVDDPSNRDRRHLRTRVREIVLPALGQAAQASNSDHSLLDRFGDLAANLGEDNDYLRSVTERAFAQGLADRQLGPDYCVVSWLKTEPASIRRRLVRYLLEALVSDHRSLSRAHQAGLLALLRRPGLVKLPGGALVSRPAESKLLIFISR